MRKSLSGNKLAPIFQKSSLEMYVDISLLDIMGVDEFLSVLKFRTENNQKDTWKEIATIVSHLKASRDFISVESQLYSLKKFQNESSELLKKSIDRLIEATRVILDVEKVNIYELDVETEELVLTYSSDKQCLGIRFSIKDSIESKYERDIPYQSIFKKINF